MGFAPFREASSERESHGLDTAHPGEPIVRIEKEIDFQSCFPAKNSTYGDRDDIPGEVIPLHAQILFMHFLPELWIREELAKLGAQGFLIGKRNQGDAGFFDDCAFGRTCVTDNRQATGKARESTASAKVKAAADSQHDVGIAKNARHLCGLA